MTDSSNIEQALVDAEVEIDDHEPSADGELETDEEKVKKSPKLILARITWIGDQITRVSRISFNHCPEFVRKFDFVFLSCIDLRQHWKLWTI